MEFPLASSTWDDAEVAAIRDVLASGMLTMGRRVLLFEEAFAHYVGSRYSVMVNSGSSANLLMVAALFYRKDEPIRRGEEVIVPAVSWSTTYYPLYQYGLRLKFVDIDAETLNYNIERLSEAISRHTRMVVAVNLLGNPCDFKRILEAIDGRDVVVVEDNCESLGAVYDGRMTGTFGLMGTFSTFFSHHISTMEGGVVVTSDEELYHILLCLRAHGWTRDLPKRNRVCGVKGDNPFSESFRFVLPGYNVRPLELSAAVGLEQLKKLPSFIRVRRENASLLQTLFSKHPYFQIQREVGQSSWFGFSFVIKERAPFTRSAVIEQLMRHCIECRPIVGGNFARSEVVKWFDCAISGNLDVADRVDRNGFFVGNHHFPLDEQIKSLAAVLNSFG